MIDNPGNALALLALLLWPVVAVVLFRALPLERALIWSILGGYMFLPQLVRINPPGIPALDKVTIPNLTAFVCCVALWGRMPSLLPQSWFGRGLFFAFLISPSLTVFNNLDPIVFGVDRIGSILLYDRSETVVPALPGLQLYDAASALAGQILLMLPFFLARQALGDERGIREILFALVVAGFLYAPLMLIEARLSPQLHVWVYGFFQHDFSQAIRFGGFRPFVFMPHGLWVAFFALMVFSAALTLWRSEAWRPLWAFAALLGVVLLIIVKTLGVLFYAALTLPLLLFARAKLILAVALTLGLVVLGYPALRGLGLVPTDAIVAKVRALDAERAHSLAFRFANEEAILTHTLARPWFGWGSWGRFFPHNPETGLTDVVVDGLWILTVGQYGWFGYGALFGLLVLPLLSLARKTLVFAAPLSFPAVALALVYAVNLFDLLPNATLIPFTWLIGGALLGYAERLGVASGPKSVSREVQQAPKAGQKSARRRAILGVVEHNAEALRESSSSKK